MNTKDPILSICIPTYKRSRYLKESLEHFRTALSGKDYRVELIVSDNHSPDETPEVAAAAKEQGLEFQYYRNEENLGSDGNFLSCFHKAKGKYVWLLGDDDYIIPEKFEFLYNVLKDGDYGLVHLFQGTPGDIQAPCRTYTKMDEFLGTIHVFITFMSANILRRDVIATIDPQKYLGTLLVQVPYYLASAVSKRENLVIFDPVLDPGHAYSTNGGYNLFQVFVRNLDGMLYELVERGNLSRKEYDAILKDIYYKWLCEYVVDILVLRRNRNFKTEGAWKILLQAYGGKPYFYYKTLRRIAGKLILR